MSLPEKDARLLKLPGPDGAVGPDRFQSGVLGRLERQGRPTLRVVETLNGIGFVVPARVVVHTPGRRVGGRIAIRRVGENIAGVMSDDVEDDVESLFVGCLDKVAELLAGPEVRIN